MDIRRPARPSSRSQVVPRMPGARAMRPSCQRTRRTTVNATNGGPLGRSRPYVKSSTRSGTPIVHRLTFSATFSVIASSTPSVFPRATCWELTRQVDQARLRVGFADVETIHCLGEAQVGVDTGNDYACIYRQELDATRETRR